MFDAGTQEMSKRPLQLVTNQGASLEWTFSRAPTGGPRVEPIWGATPARTDKRQPPPNLFPRQYVGRQLDARAHEQRPSSAQYAAYVGLGAPSQHNSRLGDLVGWRMSKPADGRSRNRQQAGHARRRDLARRVGHHLMNAGTRAAAPCAQPSSNEGMGPSLEDWSYVFVLHTLVEVRSE